MIQKQKFYHVTSLIVFAASFAFFYLLGGGTGEHDIVNNENGINTSMPEIGGNVRIGDNKLDNVAIAKSIDDKHARKVNMANSSFDWFYNDTLYSQTPSSALENSTEDKLQKALEESDRVVAEITMPDAKRNQSSVVHVTSSNDRNSHGTAEQRRAEFEKRKQAKLARLQQKQDSILALVTKPETDQTSETEEIDKAEVETTKKQSGFYGIEGNEKMKSNNIRAVVHGEHKNLQKGSVVKLRLLDNVVIGEHKIPRNTFVYAKLSFGSGRAQLTIDNINMDHFIIPFKGVIYDKDGFQGIYVPDNIVDDTKREVGSDAIKNVKLGSVLGGGLIGSAVDAIQNAASGSIKEEKISISTNYLVTIKQETKTK